MLPSLLQFVVLVLYILPIEIKALKYKPLTQYYTSVVSMNYSTL